MKTDSGDDNDDGDSGSYGPAIPSGVLRSRGGWDGDNLEIDHQRERLRSGVNENEPATVDLSQFRNVEVGKGYQAKHVIRQRDTLSHSQKVIDMSGGRFVEMREESDDLKLDSSSKRRGKSDCGDSRELKKQQRETKIASYLGCKGMRDFVKELDSTLSKN
mmetsp:Transcript_24585/g.51786  ORF Transcript_24585/g.51786 Transcript_24585/m.51786 type:complete len:161 (+) Transcript_24585:189-671(+)